MNPLTDTEAIVIMSTIPGMGPTRVRQLVEKFGSAQEALKAPQKAIESFTGFERVAPYWQSWVNKKEWRDDLAAAYKSKTTLIPFTSPHYPKSLLNLPDAPAVLYVRGSLLLADTTRSIAIVGTRQASIYGMEMAEMIAQQLAASGFTIISGLARGIDTAAHRGALKQGRTIAVIGSGLDDIYPPENHKLADTITQSGALMSEFPMNIPPRQTEVSPTQSYRQWDVNRGFVN